MLRLAAVLFCLCIPVAAQAFSHCTVKQLAGPGAHIAEEGSNPVKAGKYVYAGFTSYHVVGVAMSSDWGKTLGAPVTVSRPGGPASGLRLAAAYSNVYALWAQRLSDGLHLMLAASHDHGRSGTWDPPIDFGFKGPSTQTQISADGPNVHLVYITAGRKVAVRNSSDAGRSFSGPVTIGDAGAEVVIAGHGPDVYVSWGLKDTKSEVMFAASHDGGKTFRVQNLSASRPTGANEPILALDRTSGRLSIVWRENSPVQGVYRRSLDGGNTWSSPVILDAPTRQYMVADDGTYIYVSYLKQFYTGGHYDWDVYLTASTDGGKTFPAGRDLSGPTGIEMLTGDFERPIPWVLEGNGAFRLTGVKDDGVYAWNGRNGHVYAPAYLGPGLLAAPAFNSILWEGPNRTVMYGHCQ